MIAQFVLSLSKSVRSMEEEPKAEHIMGVSDEESSTIHHQPHGHVHDHAHADGHFSTLVLGQE